MQRWAKNLGGSGIFLTIIIAIRNFRAIGSTINTLLHNPHNTDICFQNMIYLFPVYFYFSPFPHPSPCNSSLQWTSAGFRIIHLHENQDISLVLQVCFDLLHVAEALFRIWLMAGRDKISSSPWIPFPYSSPVQRRHYSGFVSAIKWGETK
jgi:hypothetical protein